jgi:hypothetical protein
LKRLGGDRSVDEDAAVARVRLDSLGLGEPVR